MKREDWPGKHVNTAAETREAEKLVAGRARGRRVGWRSMLPLRLPLPLPS